MGQRHNIYTDGGTEPFSVICVSDKNGDHTWRLSRFATNNEAEYESVIAAINLADKESDVNQYTVNSDSKIVVNHLNREWKSHVAHLKRYKRHVTELIRKSKHDWAFEWIPREMNVAGIHLEKLRQGKNSWSIMPVHECYVPDPAMPDIHSPFGQRACRA